MKWFVLQASIIGGLSWLTWRALTPNDLLAFVFFAWLVTAFFSAGADEISDLWRGFRDRSRAARKNGGKGLQPAAKFRRGGLSPSDLPKGFSRIGEQHPRERS